MSGTYIVDPLPDGQFIRGALHMALDEALYADVRFMEAWKAERFMHPGMMLRARQIRRANPDLVAATGARPA
jgi:hypothetical protein